ncbi:hypothetical protein [Streptomyces sp. C10-9-1]|uniref:hypothetical protein n=1 Tax=Streptomyces sp. C10-9-1 TaxID=1859285 RepID=UPI003D716857
MSDVEKAARDAVEAQANAEQVALIAAVLQAQQYARQQPSAPVPVAPAGGAGKWLAIGVGGSVFLLTVAVSAVAVAIAAVALTVCVLVLRGVWADVQKDRRR